MARHPREQDPNRRGGSQDRRDAPGAGAVPLLASAGLWGAAGRRGGRVLGAAPMLSRSLALSAAPLGMLRMRLWGLGSFAPGGGVELPAGRGLHALSALRGASGMALALPFWLWRLQRRQAVDEPDEQFEEPLWRPVWPWGVFRSAVRGQAAAAGPSAAWGPEQPEAAPTRANPPGMPSFAADGWPEPWGAEQPADYSSELPYPGVDEADAGSGRGFAGSIRGREPGPSFEDADGESSPPVERVERAVESLGARPASTVRPSAALSGGLAGEETAPASWPSVLSPSRQRWEERPPSSPLGGETALDFTPSLGEVPRIARRSIALARRAVGQPPASAPEIAARVSLPSASAGLGGAAGIEAGVAPTRTGSILALAPFRPWWRAAGGTTAASGDEGQSDEGAARYDDSPGDHERAARVSRYAAEFDAAEEMPPGQSRAGHAAETAGGTVPPLAALVLRRSGEFPAVSLMAAIEEDAPIAAPSIASDREEDAPAESRTWDRLFSAPYSMPILRMEGMPTEERYAVRREEMGSAGYGAESEASEVREERSAAERRLEPEVETERWGVEEGRDLPQVPHGAPLEPPRPRAVQQYRDPRRERVGTPLEEDAPRETPRPEMSSLEAMWRYIEAKNPGAIAPWDRKRTAELSSGAEASAQAGTDGEAQAPRRVRRPRATITEIGPYGEAVVARSGRVESEFEGRSEWPDESPSGAAETPGRAGEGSGPAPEGPPGGQGVSAEQGAEGSPAASVAGQAWTEPPEDEDERTESETRRESSEIGDAGEQRSVRPAQFGQGPAEPAIQRSDAGGAGPAAPASGRAGGGGTARSASGRREGVEPGAVPGRSGEGSAKSGEPPTVREMPHAAPGLPIRPGRRPVAEPGEERSGDRAGSGAWQGDDEVPVVRRSPVDGEPPARPGGQGEADGREPSGRGEVPRFGPGEEERLPEIRVQRREPASESGGSFGREPESVPGSVETLPDPSGRVVDRSESRALPTESLREPRQSARIGSGRAESGRSGPAGWNAPYVPPAQSIPAQPAAGRAASREFAQRLISQYTAMLPPAAQPLVAEAILDNVVAEIDDESAPTAEAAATSLVYQTYEESEFGPALSRTESGAEGVKLVGRTDRETLPGRSSAAEAIARAEMVAERGSTTPPSPFTASAGSGRAAPESGGEQRVRLELLLASLQHTSSAPAYVAMAPVDRPAQQPGAAGGTVGGESQGTQEGQEQEPDLDEMARKVYGLLKERLAVERERMGGIL